METVYSADGTKLAFDRCGEGPPVIMVAGAFNTRETTAPLARALAPGFTVLNFDRRGRGDSGDSAPYSVEREIDDIAVLISAAGGAASVFGYSFRWRTGTEAAACGLAITSLALYEPPLSSDDSYPLLRMDLADRLAGLVAAGRRGDAVELFQGEAVGIPPEVIAQLRHAPFWPALEDIAHTLVYDAMILGDRSIPAELVASVLIPTLVLCGEQSPPFLREGARALTEALPGGRLCTLSGQTHDINPAVTAAALAEFLTGEAKG